MKAFRVSLRENQKLSQVFKKLGQVFVLQHGPCCPTQPRSYTSSYNLALAISGVLTGWHMISCSPTWPTCCNSSRKCTSVKYKARQKAGFLIVTGFLTVLPLKITEIMPSKQLKLERRYEVFFKELSRSFVHKKHFSLIWQVVFKLGQLFCQER